MYLIEFSDKAREIQLPKIPKNMRIRILNAIQERLTVNPEERGKPLIKEWKDHRRIRVGDYRVIYKIEKERVVVLVVEIDHRKDVYLK